MGTDVQRAADLLMTGHLVAIPTETVYGLAANGLDPAAVVKIYEVKKRPQFNPLILHFASLQHAEQLPLEIPEKVRQLAAVFSPGPLTYVIPSNERIPDIVTAGTGAVAIRFPHHPLTQQLLERLPFPLAAPSANLSGSVSPTTAAHVQEQLGDQVAYILDGGASDVGLESTIISFLNDHPKLLRYGGTTIEAIEAIIGKVEKPEEGFVDNPVAPGQLARHYATRHPLLLGDAKKLIEQAHRQDPIPRIASISLNQVFNSLPAAYQFQLSPNGKLEEAAQKLFAAMRMADEMDIDLIIADRFPDEGLGLAINDRLTRAATPENQHP